MTKTRFAGVDRGDVLAGLVLVVLAGLTFWPYHSPALTGDDWTQAIWWPLDGRWIDLDGSMTGSRILQPAVMGLLSLAGVGHVDWLYLGLWLVNIVWILAVYALCRRVFALDHRLALLSTALALVNPADVTWSWLTMFALRGGAILGLFHILLQERLLTTGKWRFAVPATLCLWASLLTYESTAGIMIAWPVIAWYRYRSWRLPRALLLPPAAFALYAALRLTYFTPDGFDRAGRTSFNVATVLGRWVLGAKVLVVAWLEPVEQALAVARPLAAVLVVAACAGLAAAGLALARRVARPETGREPLGQPSVGQALAGPGLAIAGYFPIVLIAGPRLRLHDTRFNTVAVIGAALTIAVLTTLLVRRFVAPRLQRPAQVAALLPLLLLGMAVQVATRHDVALHWQQQRAAWLAVLDAIPELAPGTVVDFDVAGLPPPHGLMLDRSRIQKRFDLTEWDTTNALRMLYGRRDVSGAVLGDGSARGRVLMDFRSRTPVDVSKLVIVRLLADGRVHVVQQGDAVKVGGSVLDLRGYQPNARILSTPGDRSLAASLLQAPRLAGGEGS